MRLAALIFGIVGTLAHLIGAIIAMLIGLVPQTDSYDYSEMAEGLLSGMGGMAESFDSEGDFDRLLAMGILGLVAAIVGSVGVGFAMFKPKVAMWLMAPPSAIGLLAIMVGYYQAPGLIILASFAMVLFLWAAALEYVESKPRGAVTTTEAASTDEGTSGEDEAPGEAATA